MPTHMPKTSLSYACVCGAQESFTGWRIHQCRAHARLAGWTWRRSKHVCPKCRDTPWLELHGLPAAPERLPISRSCYSPVEELLRYEVLAQGFAQLEPFERRFLELFYFEDATYEQAALGTDTGIRAAPNLHGTLLWKLRRFFAEAESA